MSENRVKNGPYKKPNGNSVNDSVGSFNSLNEVFLPTPEQSQEIITKFKSIIDTRLDKLYDTRGADGEMYAYGIAVNQVKKKAEQPEETPAGEAPTEDNMDKDQKLKEMIQAALSKPLDKTIPVKEGNHNAKDFRPYIAKDLNNPNFLKVFIQYPTQTGFTTALGQRTMTGQDREYNVEKAMKIGQAVAAKLESKYNLEDLDVYDNEDGKVIVFAVSDDFIEMNTPPTGLDEDLDLGHQDDEPHMLKADLYRIGKYAMELYKMVDQFEGEQEVDFPHWWQSKIIKAKDMLVSAKHYLDFELKEPQLDAMVDVASEEGAIDEMSKKQIKKRGKIYDALKAKGMSDEKAGKIATSQAMKAKIKEAIIAKLKSKK
jgi:hypothetical protein